MKAAKPYSFEFPVAKKKDVVVVGGGPGGFMAALSASRNGADTLLIERDNYLGGMMTGGLVTSVWGFRHEQGFRLGKAFEEEIVTSNWDTPLLVNGISLEVMTRVGKKGGRLEQGHLEDPSLHELIDPEITKLVLDEMMEESRVEVLYNTFAFNAVVEDNVAKGVAIANKSGGRVVLADMVVDASGDADIAAAAGAPFEIGRKEDGRHMGGSLMMEIGGIDVHKYINYLKNRPKKTEKERQKQEEEDSRLLGGGGTQDRIVTLDGEKGQYGGGGGGRQINWDGLDQVMEEGKFPLRLPGIEGEWLEFVKSGRVPAWHGAVKLIYIRPTSNSPGLLRGNKLRYDQARAGVHEAYFDQTNQEEITKAIIWMRKMDGIYLDFLRERIPGFENAYIIQISPMVGTRESRRITGEYTLTERDCVEGRRFPDVIAKGGYACNIHSVTGVWGDGYFMEVKKPFDIPYRCLVPKKIENLLVAGRCISVTHVALGATRTEPPCMATGEAAGAAAALSAKLGVAPRNLDIKILQKALLDQGVLLYLADEMPGAVPAA